MNSGDHFCYCRDHFDEGGVNLTPLIDVVFVVLIMFILVAPLVELEQITLAEASTKKKNDMPILQDQVPIKIYVYSDNTIWLNGTPVTIEELLTSLKRTYRQFPYAHPQLYHDKKACFGTYQSIKNVVESVGFASLDLILQSN